MSEMQLNATFAALSDPTRRAILAQLSQGDATVSALAEPFAMSMPAITKHLKVPEKAGLVERGRDAQTRPVILRAEPLKEATDWINQYKIFWETRLDQLEVFLKNMQKDDTNES